MKLVPSKRDVLFGATLEICLAALSVFVAPSPLSIFLAFPGALLADLVGSAMHAGMIVFYFIGVPLALVFWTLIFAWLSHGFRKISEKFVIL